MEFEACNQLVRDFELAVKNPILTPSSVYYAGVDLGTACVVVAILDENRKPVAGMYQYANVVRDGMVVDYIGAVDIVKNMKKKLEEALDTELIYASAAIPPGTDSVDGGVLKNVVESAGFILTNLSDEPTAANEVLKIQNGAVVDIGGGTTGISIFEDGKVISVRDDVTGGTHFSLTLAGAMGISYEEAELIKRDPEQHKRILPVVTPVVEKVASIIENAIRGYHVDHIVLVGGTACLTGIEAIVEKRLGITTVKPENPMFVTPLGIAMQCKTEEYVRGGR